MEIKKRVNYRFVNMEDIRHFLLKARGQEYDWMGCEDIQREDCGIEATSLQEYLNEYDQVFIQTNIGKLTYGREGQLNEGEPVVDWVPVSLDTVQL